jgi:hypothetical protein
MAAAAHEPSVVERTRPVVRHDYQAPIVTELPSLGPRHGRRGCRAGDRLMPQNPWLAIDATTPPMASAKQVRRAWEHFLGEGRPDVDRRRMCRQTARSNGSVGQVTGTSARTNISIGFPLGTP